MDLASIPSHMHDRLKLVNFNLGKTIVEHMLDKNIDEIMLNDNGALFIEHKDHGMQQIGSMSAEKADSLMRTLASMQKKVIDDKCPILSCAIPIYNSRFEGLIPPLVKNPIFSIRAHHALSLSLERLVNNKMLNKDEALFLEDCIKQKRSIIVCGTTGCGKTTLINALLDKGAQLCPSERVISIEDTPELILSHKNSLSLYTSDDVDMSALVRSSLRLRPDRIVVGEIRGPEALDFIDAIQTGHSGGFCTLHAGSTSQALSRLELLVSRHKSAPAMIREFLKQSLDVILVLKAHPYRHVHSIDVVTGLKAGAFITQRISKDKEFI